ncbi:polysaccharide biosynthesis tyrosine autokinase [Oscillatoria sp. FACHB-1407]|uniref:GumC family protein n=1 Tax=Oscillatoria sp. FACHB-1407 TaxID=2692847 RepID=UPI001683ED1B|nr:polysaccharide biosynthesis tyrosine autokinase [Oscillatoria sp. FACHB-1407]MBD2459687.1 polysaccharide biosynthesis tyrosine autokinase [Oscillatoria sp. FACHB-1407]
MEVKEYQEEIDFQRYWLILRRHWLPAAGVLVTSVLLSAVALALKSPVYKADGQLLFQSDRTSSLTGLLGEENQLGQLNALTQKSDPLSTQAEVIRSLPVIEDAIKSIEAANINTTSLDPQEIADRIEIKPLTGTDVLQISFESTDPRLSAAVVNSVMNAYLKNNISTNREEAVSASQFIITQLPKTEASVREVEEQLRRFKEANQLVLLDQEVIEAVKTIEALQNQIADAQAQYSDVAAQSRELQQRLGMDLESAVNASVLSQSTGVQTLLAELQEVQSQLAIARTRYSDIHPTVRGLQRQEIALSNLLEDRVVQILGEQRQFSGNMLQMGELRQEITANLLQLEATRFGLEQRISQLVAIRDSYQRRANDFPQLEKTQRELERQLKAAQTTYETLLTRLQEIQVAENQAVGNARIIEPATVPEDTIGPQKPLFLAAGVFVGTLLAVATAFLLDITDKSVKTSRDIRELLRYPVLGIIPAFDLQESPVESDNPAYYSSRLVVKNVPRSSVSAIYQMLQANLKFLGSDKELQGLVISSTLPQEGKSEVSANLAIAIAQSGRRVLLVDADMRHPTQHHIWQLANSTGLSNVIVGQVKYQSAVSEVDENLSVLTAGVVPPNPVALLNSERMVSLVSEFLSAYDFVVFDTPPLSGTADAAILGKLVDGILLTVRPGIVTTISANVVKEFLTQSNHQVLGMVINGVQVQDEPSSYFYHTQDDTEEKLIRYNVRYSRSH